MHEYKENEKFLLLVYMSMNQLEINITAPNETLFEILRSCSCGTSENESDRITTEMESTKTTKKKKIVIQRMMHALEQSLKINTKIKNM